jgi:hypothetical protein
MTPREVLPMNPGVKIGLRPGNDRRPRRGVRVPVVLSSVKSSISGGSWFNLGAGESPDIMDDGGLKRRRTVIVFFRAYSFECKFDVLKTARTGLRLLAISATSPLCAHVIARYPAYAILWRILWRP